MIPKRAAATEVAWRRTIEDDFWRDSPTEGPDAHSIHNILNKAHEAVVFLKILESYRPAFECADSILELGGGQGWASCVVKRVFPSAAVVATDISEHAIASVPKWERIYEVQLDDVRACASDNIDAADSSVDVLFAFAAAHHFIAHHRTLGEIRRVLKPGGRAFYFYEPSCRAYVYRAARWRVTRKRPEVPEDVLVYGEIRQAAEDAGLEHEISLYPSAAHRGPTETIYYTLLARFPSLQRVLPCTANYTFRRPV